MKPLKLEMQAFGPYADLQTVDFEKLSEKGMFLIKGNTGSGKTTIFDAMTFALYGGGSGEDAKSRVGRNDLMQWRCTQCRRELDTFVSLTFSVRGRKYRFRRILEPKRINFSMRFEACEIDADGNEIPFFTNPKEKDLNTKAEELIGLNKEQFRQVVLLPQGQFERFLTASSSEKEDILQKIFGTQKWEQYAGFFFESASQKKQQLDSEKKDVMAALAEEEADSVDALFEKIEQIRTEEKEAQKQHLAFNGKQKQEALNRDLLLSQDFNRLHTVSKQAKDLERQQEARAGEKTRFEQAERAETVRTYVTAFESGVGELALRKKELTEKQALRPKAISREADANAKKEAHDSHSPVPALTKMIGEYEGKIRAYQEYTAIKSACFIAQKEQEAAKKEYDRIKREGEHQTGNAKAYKDLFDQADEKARIYRNRYFKGIYGEIAETLVEGEPCPVCGSTTHPHVAVKMEDSVSKEQMEAAEADASRYRKKWEDAEKIRAEGEQKRKEKESVLTEKDAAFLEAKTRLEAAEQNLIEGIGSETMLRARIQETEKKIAAYNAEGMRLEAARMEAVNARTALEEAIRRAEAEQQKAEEALSASEKELNRVLSEKGYLDAAAVKEQLLSQTERNRLHESIVTYETSVQEKRKALLEIQEKLKGQKEPDAAAFSARQKEINEEATVFDRRDAELKTAATRLTRKAETLSKKWEHYRANIQQAESDLAFARKLRGDTGIGIQRYVLAIMFNQVIGEANRMLKNVHGGRYQLYRSDDRGAGNKRGLELKVHDSRCPEQEGRSVGMLSGGEKFLVSLSLSIGMSAVAQKTGVQIEALFIDEGFGTLDDHSIQDAMSVLDSVQKSSGTIGIISHVSLLEANIPTHLEVVKRDTGSLIRIC